MSADGSHAGGLSYVPFDGYNAILHKGERVLTAEENRQYPANTQQGYKSQTGSSGGGISIDTIEVPTTIIATQTLDESTIKQFANKIGEVAVKYINDGMNRKGTGGILCVV
jgi:hypothetical protein